MIVDPAGATHLMLPMPTELSQKLKDSPYYTSLDYGKPPLSGFGKEDTTKLSTIHENHADGGTEGRIFGFFYLVSIMFCHTCH